MTSTTVTQINRYFNNVTGNKDAQKKQNSSFMDCFSQAYGGQNGSGIQNAESIKMPQKNENLQAGPDYHQDKLQLNKPDSANEPVKVTKPSDIPGKDQDIMPEVEEAAEEVIEAVASQLGISMEAVREMMAQNGMTAADMLNPEQVTQLMTELAGEGNSLALLTNGELFEDVEQVMQKLDDVLNRLSGELQMDPGELKAMIEAAGERLNAKMQKQASENGGDTREVIVESPQDTIVRQPAADAAQADGKANEVKQTDTQEEPVITVENEKPLETVAKQETTPQQNGGKENSDKESRKGQSGDGRSNPEQLGPQTAGKTDINAVVQELTAEIHQAPDTEHIMRQIMDYMKVQIKADMTQMEIQLHPSSLGSVNIQISAREGVITAQFTAQNETVKAALETQIVQLKENLAEQGVKVEAVEVTIASHSFERNLQQEGGQNAKEEQDKKKGPKRLNLNLAAGENTDAENMETADRIAVEMMTRNGGTVDFSA